MKRALIATTVAVLALAGSAQGRGFGNDYQGRAEADPSTYVGFDLEKSAGVRKLTRVSASLPYRCTNGLAFKGSTTVDGRLRVRKGGTFGGTLKVTIPARARPARRGGVPEHFSYAVSGKLLEHGKARGTIDAEDRFTLPEMRPARGEQKVRCYSGRLDWRAEKIGPP